MVAQGIKGERTLNVKMVIYTKPNCPKCRETKNRLDAAGYKVSQISLNVFQPSQYEDRLLRSFKSKGYKSLPVVKVYAKDNQLIDEWNALNVDKINKYVSKNE